MVNTLNNNEEMSEYLHLIEMKLLKFVYIPLKVGFR